MSDTVEIGQRYKDVRSGSDTWEVRHIRHGICELKSERRPTVYRFHDATKLADTRYYVIQPADATPVR